MILYLDTSALVKRYIKEARSEEVFELVENAESVGSSALAKVEIAAALERAVRQKWITRRAASRAWQDFLDHWPSFTRLNVSSGTIDRASAVAQEYNLRGYAAVHLAGCLLWQETLDTQITLATFDRELWGAGSKARLTTWPATMHS